MNILIAQISSRVGCFTHNTQVLLDALLEAASKNCKLVVTPEFSLCGYPPEDLLYREGFYEEISRSLTTLQVKVDLLNVSILIGMPNREGDELHNSMVLLAPKAIPVYCRKIALPNYGVFDEKRYFTPGTEITAISVEGHSFAVLVCEDIWNDEVVGRLQGLRLDGIISVNASPFDYEKAEHRKMILKKRVGETKLPILYVNAVSGQDELIFDGGSFALDVDAQTTLQAKFFKQEYLLSTFEQAGFTGPISAEPISEESLIINALIFSLREYCEKNGFKKLYIGLSGGIDSALVLALSVQAVGAENVCAVMMPTKYTSEMSLVDAKQLATNLQVDYKVIPISELCDKSIQLLEQEFLGLEPDTTEENIQARIRGVILMALANKSKGMVVSTGNKSELAVGYCTIYGDMVGGFALIKDLYKTQVFRICKFMNQENMANIPENIISRPPSAELRFDQKDEDTLPLYKILDGILKCHIEMNMSESDIILQGYAAEEIERVLRLIKSSEYKRKQSPVGPKISSRSFGKDWRLPISY